MWQNPSLLPEFTALENVMMPLLIRGTAPDEAAATARARLDEVGLRAREIASRRRTVGRRATARRAGEGARREAPRCCWPMSLPAVWIIGPAR